MPIQTLWGEVCCLYLVVWRAWSNPGRATGASLSCWECLTSCVTSSLTTAPRALTDITSLRQEDSNNLHLFGKIYLYMFWLITRLLLDSRYQAKYGWTEQEMSTYLFDYRLGYMLSLWILVPIMTNWLSLSDNVIAIIACLLSATGRRGIYAGIMALSLLSLSLGICI